jgi:hypothetical protein
MRYLKMLFFFLIDGAIFALAYFTGMYKSLFFTSILSSIAELPVPSFISSFLILLTMSVPIYIVLFLINKKIIKIDAKSLFYVHIIFILVCLVSIESLLQFAK